MKNKTYGFSTLELTLSFAVLAVLFGLTIFYMNPGEFRARELDNKRLSDLLNLDRAINEFSLDYGRYPSPVNTLFTSVVSPFEGAPSLTDSRYGWLGDDLSDYLSSLPIDPENDATYFYSYIHTETSYELNARLGHFSNKMQEDGGNDPNLYELGNNLSLLSP